VWTPLIPASFGKEKVQQFGSEVPMKRAGQPAEVAPSYVFLASEQDSSYMSGQFLHDNGMLYTHTHIYYICIYATCYMHILTCGHACRRAWMCRRRHRQRLERSRGARGSPPAGSPSCPHGSPFAVCAVSKGGSDACVVTCIR
jgi:hypothetical protein